VTFSEDVTGFDLNDISVTNGTASNFVMVDARTYTFDVAPAADGLVTVTVTADAATDVAGNGNTEASFSITSDRFDPIPTFTTTVGNPTNQSPIPFTVTFNKDVTGFEASDLVVTNGTVSNFVMVDARTYTFDVTPAANGLVTVMVPAGVAMDLTGRPNVAASLSITFDDTPPAAPVVTGLTPGTDSGTVGDGITNVNLPTLTGTAEAGATIEIFANDGSGAVSLGTTVADSNGNWSFTPTTPIADERYDITVTATDPAGNVSPASAAFVLVIDTSAPVASITTTASSPTNLAVIPFTVTFEEDVQGFAVNDLTVTNGVISNFVMVNARTFTFDITPMADGMVTVMVNAAAVQDTAGNASAEQSLSITSDRTPPTGTISPTSNLEITGGAGDGTSGVASVMISIFNGTSYWDGSGFNSATPMFFAATTTNNYVKWTFPFNVNGTFTVTAVIMDFAGNTTTITQTVTIGP
jgi:hypothetical protein